MFDQVNIIDTEKDMFDVNGEAKTMQEIIDYFLGYSEKELSVTEMEEIINVWAEVFPGFWW